MVLGVHGTQKSLCRNVQPDRLRHGVVETRFRLQPIGTGSLVSVIYATFRAILTKVVDQVSNIVEQCGDDFMSRTPLLFSQLGGLQRVIELCHGFASIKFASLVRKEAGKAVDDVGDLALGQFFG